MEEQSQNKVNWWLAYTVAAFFEIVGALLEPTIIGKIIFNFFAVGIILFWLWGMKKQKMPWGSFVGLFGVVENTPIIGALAPGWIAIIWRIKKINKPKS